MLSFLVHICRFEFGINTKEMGSLRMDKTVQLFLGAHFLFGIKINTKHPGAQRDMTYYTGIS